MVTSLPGGYSETNIDSTLTGHKENINNYCKTADKSKRKEWKN